MAAVIRLASCSNENKPADAKQAVRFHLSRNFADLNRAVDFFRVFFQAEPANCRADDAKFELNRTFNDACRLTSNSASRTGGRSKPNSSRRFPALRRPKAGPPAAAAEGGTPTVLLDFCSLHV
jgi:hypothetical protein